MPAGFHFIATTAAFASKIVTNIFDINSYFLYISYSYIAAVRGMPGLKIRSARTPAAAGSWQLPEGYRQLRLLSVSFWMYK